MRISPSNIQVGNVEEFVTVYGSGFTATESTLVVFDGPAGHFELLPSNLDDTTGQAPDGLLQVWIPVEVAVTAGTYQLSVVATNVGEVGRVSGPIDFTVSAAPLDGPPVITSNETVVAEATNSEGAVVFYDVSANSQDGTPLAVTCSNPSGSQFSMGVTHVSCSATDSFGTTTASIYVIVGDFTTPIVTVPNDINTAAREVTFTATATDNIDGPLPVTCTPASGSLFPLGVTRVYCVATDASLNTGEASFLVRVAGGGEPVLTVPADITVTSPEGRPVVVPYDVTATNGGDIECLPSGNVFPVGVTTVTCTATNLTGTDTKSFHITVNSGAAPVIMLPADITAEATSAAGAVVTFATNASNDGVVTCSPASGSTFPLGQTTVTCTATNAGGSDTGTFHITVRDTTPPVLVLPADITAEATSAAGAAVTYTTSASDLVDGSVAVQCTPISGSTFPLGTSNVSCSASDTRGNTSTGLFHVLVADTTPPQILSVTASPNTLWPPNHNMVDVTVEVIAIDAVDTNPISHIISVSSSQPINGTGDGDTGPDWTITGPLTLKLRSERSQGVDRIYTITVETVDDAGNTATATETVKVTQSKRRAVH